MRFFNKVFVSSPYPTQTSRPWWRLDTRAESAVKPCAEGQTYGSLPHHAQTEALEHTQFGHLSSTSHHTWFHVAVFCTKCLRWLRSLENAAVFGSSFLSSLRFPLPCPFSSSDKEDCARRSPEREHRPTSTRTERCDRKNALPRRNITACSVASRAPLR